MRRFGTCVEHIDGPKIDFLENLKHFVDRDQENGGSIILSTMGKNFKSQLVTIFAAEKLLGIVPEGTHNYENYIEAGDLKDLVESLGCKVERLEGMFYNPISQAWSFSDDLDVNYILHARF